MSMKQTKKLLGLHSALRINEVAKNKKNITSLQKFHSMGANFGTYIVICIKFFFSNNDSFSYFSCQWKTRKTLGFHLAFHTNKMATNKKILLLLQNFIPWWQILTPRLLCVLDILVQIMMHSDIFHVNESNKKIIGSPFGLKTH